MNLENVTDNEFLTVENAPAARGLKRGNYLVWFHLIVFLVGLGLLSFIVYYTGFQTVVESLKRVGWAFFLIAAFNGARHALRALCIYRIIPAEHRRFSYFHVFTARLGGEAVSFLTFSGPLLGEAAKAALLSKRVRLAHGVTAVVVDNILYDLSVVVIILGGAALLLYTYAVGDQAVLNVLFGTIVFAVLCVAGLMLLVKYRIKPVSWLVGKFSGKSWFPKVAAAKKDGIAEVESNVYEFYTRRRAAFFGLLGLDFVTHALSVTEVYLALYFLGLTPTVVNSFIIESLVKVINLVFGFVPGTVGVYEGGTGVILNILGFATASGVMLGLVRKGASLFWTLAGLVILLYRALPRS